MTVCVEVDYTDDGLINKVSDWARSWEKIKSQADSTQKIECAMGWGKYTALYSVEGLEHIGGYPMTDYFLVAE